MEPSLKELPATFTTRMARVAGIHPRDLYRWRDDGLIVTLSRGVFRHKDAPPASYPDALAVAHRTPLAILCCLTAAAIHDLTDEPVSTIQFAVPKGSHTPKIDYPPTTVFKFEASTFELGSSRIEAAPNEWVRIYDPARTVVDLLRLRHRFGEPTAHSALKRFLSSDRSRPSLLLEYSRALGSYGPTRLAIDIATAR